MPRRILILEVSVMSEVLLEKLAKAVADGDATTAETCAKQAVDGGLDRVKVIEEVSRAIKRVGDDFGRGMLFLPDLMMASEAMKACMRILLAGFTEEGGKQLFLGRVVLGTVAGDIHCIGKNLVRAFLEANNFQVIDLGEDVADEVFVEKVREMNPDIVGMSALLTTTVERQREIIKTLKKAKLREKVKVMVGGSVASQSWAEEIGADAYGADAVDAVARANKLVGSVPQR
jgi:5-methyltetrahydrofolate--homocysteine methyltransferase